MLRFFRQIRKSLMEQNKIRSYLFYAIGEVALVMIGILLALQVNNWNEERKMSSLKETLLINVQKDLNIDLDQLVIVRNDIIEKEKLGMYLMNYFNSDKSVSEFDINRLRQAFMNTADVQEFTPNRLGYDELLSTGMINRINDDSLKILLTDHYEISVRESFENAQRERYDIAYVDGRFEYVPKLALREKVKSMNQILDWKEDPYDDFQLEWNKIRTDGKFPMYLGKLLALHLATIIELDQTEKDIVRMINKISTEVEMN